MHFVYNFKTRKSPITYNFYKKINEYVEGRYNRVSICSSFFLCITWNLICHSKNTTTIFLHHLEWSDDCLNKQRKRFAKYFDFILNKYSTEIMDEFGLDVKDIGVHLLRKGAASYLSLGSNVHHLK